VCVSDVIEVTSLITVAPVSHVALAGVIINGRCVAVAAALKDVYLSDSTRLLGGCLVTCGSAVAAGNSASTGDVSQSVSSNYTNNTLFSADA